ncbi:MAG: hypothetical protein P1P85_04915 [Patescibacteria group bacterium]|nr:hypothetical protein [Patescibacteria group bacterium]
MTIIKNDDINFDDSVNFDDVTYLIRHTRKIPYYEELYNEVADVCDNGKVDFMNDVVYLARHIMDCPGYETLY